MKSQYKPFFITIICELLLALFFYSTNGLGYETDVLFWNHIYERVFIAIIWPFIALIRNTKEKNTKYLKIALIIIEIYLFLLIFVQDWSNLNKREFFVLYLCILWLIKETIYKRYKKRQKNFFISIYWIVAIFIVSIGCLMRYRQPLDIQKIIDNKDYIFITHFNWSINKDYTNITLTDWNITEYINPDNWSTSYPIRKNKEYNFSFSTQSKDKNNYIIIQDPLGNILQIFPQTLIDFSTYENQIQFKDFGKETKYYSSISTFPDELIIYKTNYENIIKNNVLSNLPPMLRSNQKLQKLSYKFTKFLSKLLPFWYNENWKIADNYLPYFSFPEEKGYKWVFNKYELIKSNWNIWINNTNWWNKYSEYLKKVFHDTKE